VDFGSNNYFPIFTLFSSNRIKTIKIKNQHKSQQPKIEKNPNHDMEITITILKFVELKKILRSLLNVKKY